jgi:hypothetical protein
VIILGHSAPLTCMLEGGPSVFAGSYLVEARVQVVQPAGG